MSYNVQSMSSLTLDRTLGVQREDLVFLSSRIPNALPGFYVQGGTGGGRISHVRIKRPDGTWAVAFSIAGVHVKKVDGTWEVLS